MNSIIAVDEEYRCFICGSTEHIEEHHIFGGSNRKWSEEYGLKVHLCKHHHTGDINGRSEAVHFNAYVMDYMHMIGQQEFERIQREQGLSQEKARIEFRRVFGRTYL